MVNGVVCPRAITFSASGDPKAPLTRIVVSGAGYAPSNGTYVKGPSEFEGHAMYLKEGGDASSMIRFYEGTWIIDQSGPAPYKLVGGPSGREFVAGTGTWQPFQGSVGVPPMPTVVPPPGGSGSSHATWPCPADATEAGCLFECRVGLEFDKAAAGPGDAQVTFVVRVDGQPVWQSAPVNRATITVPRCRVGVSGAEVVTLEARFKGDSAALASVKAAWIDPRFTWDRSDAIGKCAVVYLCTPESKVEGVQIFGRAIVAAAAAPATDGLAVGGVVVSSDCFGSGTQKHVYRNEMDLACIPAALKPFFDSDPGCVSDRSVTALLACLDIASKLFEVRRRVLTESQVLLLSCTFHVSVSHVSVCCARSQPSTQWRMYCAFSWHLRSLWSS